MVTNLNYMRQIESWLQESSGFIRKNKGVWNHLLKFLMVGFDIGLLYCMSIPYQVTTVDSHDFKPPEVDFFTEFHRFKKV